MMDADEVGEYLEGTEALCVECDALLTTDEEKAMYICRDCMFPEEKELLEMLQNTKED